MSKEQIESIQLFANTMLKYAAIALLSVVGYLAVDSYTTVKETIKETQRNLEIIKDDVNDIKVEQTRVRGDLELIRKDVNR